MDGAAMAIEALGAIIMKKDKELEKQQETIDGLRRKIKLFEDYIDVYESFIQKGENSNGDEN